MLRFTFPVLYYNGMKLLISICLLSSGDMLPLKSVQPNMTIYESSLSTDHSSLMTNIVGSRIF